MLREMTATLEQNPAVVEVHRERRVGERRRLYKPAAVICVQFVDETLGSREKGTGLAGSRPNSAQPAVWRSSTMYSPDGASRGYKKSKVAETSAIR
jgi:hypothetical protein